MNRIKNITVKQDLPIYLRFVYFIYFFTLFNRDLRYTQVIWYSANIVTLLASFWRIVSTQGLKIKLNFYANWIIFFAGWGLLSYVWAISVDDVIDASKTVILSYTVFYFIYECITGKECLVSLLRIILCSAVATSLWILSLTNIYAVIFEGARLGYETTGVNWNANDIGLFASKAALIAMAVVYEHKGKYIAKVMLAIVSLIVLLSGSRKAIIIFALYVLLFSIFKSKKGRLLNSLIAFSVIIVLTLFVLKNVYLYNLIGRRIVSMINGLFLGGTTENSFNEHSILITAGIMFFRKSPIIGYGLMNFHVLFHRIYPWNYSAHNNYVELLVDLGIIGFVLYYSIEVYIVGRFIKKRIYSESTDALIVFIMLICDFLSQIACVTYDDPACTMLIMLGMASIKTSQGREETMCMEVLR